MENKKPDDLVLLYIDSTTQRCSMREMHKQPTDVYGEHFLAIVDFRTAATICNRANDYLATKEFQIKSLKTNLKKEQDSNRKLKTKIDELSSRVVPKVEKE